MEIAPGKAVAANINLAGDADGLRLTGFRIEDVELKIRDGNADDGTARSVGLTDWAVGDEDGGFGDAIHVNQLRGGVAMGLKPWLEAGHVEGFAAEDNVTQRQLHQPGGALPGVDELAEGAGGLVEDGDFFAAEQLIKFVRTAAGEEGHYHEPAPVEQGTPDFPDAEIKGSGVEQRPHIVLVEAIPGLRRSHETGYIPVRDHAALGLASRAAGVDNIGEVIRSDGGGGIVVRLGGEEVSGFVKKEGLALMGGELFGGNALGEQDVRTGVFEHEGETPCRVARIDRKIGSPCFQDPQQGAEKIRFAVHAEAHEGIRHNALTNKPVANAVGAVVQSGIRQDHAATIDGDAVGVLRGDFFKPAVQAGRFRESHLMGIEAVDEGMALGCIEEGEAADFLIGEGAEGVGESDKMGKPALDGFLLEKVAAEGAAEGHAVMALEDIDAEVEGEAALGIAHGRAG